MEVEGKGQRLRVGGGGGGGEGTLKLGKGTYNSARLVTTISIDVIVSVFNIIVVVFNIIVVFVCDGRCVHVGVPAVAVAASLLRCQRHRSLLSTKSDSRLRIAPRRLHCRCICIERWSQFFRTQNTLE